MQNCNKPLPFLPELIECTLLLLLDMNRFATSSSRKLGRDLSYVFLLVNFISIFEFPLPELFKIFLVFTILFVLKVIWRRFFNIFRQKCCINQSAYLICLHISPLLERVFVGETINGFDTINHIIGQAL